MSIKREWTTPITAGAFLLLAVTGLLMFFHAAPELAEEVHEWLSLVFVTAVLLHLTTNFSAFKRYLSQRRAQVILGVFAVLVLVSVIPFEEEGEEGPPFAAPIRLLAKAPLAEVAQLAKSSPEQMIAELKKEGIAVQSAQQSLSELVGDDLRKQMHFMQMMLEKREPKS